MKQHIFKYLNIFFKTSSIYGTYIYIHVSLIVWSGGGGGVGCSAQVEMIPITCASLVTNATGPKMTRAGLFYTFFVHVSCQ